MSKKAQRLTDIVRDKIEEDPVIRQGLERGLLNVRSLARHIQSTAGSGATLGAIVSAIRRNPVDVSAGPRPVGPLISKLTLRDQISAFGIMNFEEIWGALLRLTDEIQVSRGDVLRIISGVEATTVVIDTKNADKLRALIPKERIGKVFTDMAEIIVQLRDSSWETTGVLSTLATQLSLSGINLLFHFGYGPPPCIVFEVSEKDAIKGYEAMEKLRRRPR